MVFADPFGNYTQGFREGQQDELALGMYNLGARRAGTDYEKALQDLRTGELDYGLRQVLDPYRIRSAEAELFEREANAGALGARIGGDPSTMQRAMSYFDPGYRFAPDGTLMSPLGVERPASTLLGEANYNFAPLPRAQVELGNGGGAAYGMPFAYDPFGTAAPPPQGQPQPAIEQSVPRVEPQPATAPAPSPSIPSEIGFGLGDIFRNYTQPFRDSAAAFRSAFDYAPAQPMPEMYGPPAPVRPNPNDYYWLR